MIPGPFLATFAAGVVSGATRKTALPQLLDAPPSIESVVFLAPASPPIVAGGIDQEQP